MKTLRKLLLVAPLFLIFTCSENESVQTVPKETIALEDGLDIDYKDLTVVTIDGEGEIDENGSFDVSTNSNKVDGLPVIIMKGEEPWFGYYPKADTDNNVTLDDILFFYFSIIPEIGMHGLSDSDLVTLIKGHSNYGDLKNQIKNSLNSNQSPMKNEAFVNLLISSVESSIDTPKSKISMSNKGDFIGGFQFSHTRGGEISWPDQVPLFANLGFEIRNKTDNSVVFGPHIIESKSITLSTAAGIYWIYNELFGEEQKNGALTSFQLNPEMEGEYEIFFTNGRNANSDALAEKVYSENKNQWIALVLQQVVPLGSKVLKKLKIQCGEPFGDLMISIGEKAYEQVLLNKNLTAEDMFKTLDDVRIEVLKMSTQCGEVSWGSWFDRMLRFVDVFNRAGKISELMFATRDWIWSDITGVELRYFYDKVSFGYLKSETISPREFIGKEGSEHLYEATIKERVAKYEVRRGLTESTFTDKEEFLEAHELPFNVEKVNGDAVLKFENPHETQNGTLFVDFVMGEENSEFKISPTFLDDSNKYGYTYEIVNLIKADIDSTEIYEQAILGHWIRTGVNDGVVYDVFYEENGGGKYSQEEAAWANVAGPRQWFDVNWHIYKREGRYYLNTGIFLWGVRPTDPLIYPPTFINEYATELSGGGLIQTYSKVE